MKFEDLKFEPHQMAIPFIENEKNGIQNDLQNMAKKEGWLDCMQSNYKRDDGVSFSIIFGKSFYSNGIDTYEVLKSTEDEPVGPLTKQEVEDYINEV